MNGSTITSRQPGKTAMSAQVGASTLMVRKRLPWLIDKQQVQQEPAPKVCNTTINIDALDQGAMSDKPGVTVDSPRKTREQNTHPSQTDAWHSPLPCVMQTGNPEGSIPGSWSPSISASRQSVSSSSESLQLAESGEQDRYTSSEYSLYPPVEPATTSPAPVGLHDIFLRRSTPNGIAQDQSHTDPITLITADPVTSGAPDPPRKVWFCENCKSHDSTHGAQRQAVNCQPITRKERSLLVNTPPHLLALPPSPLSPAHKEDSSLDHNSAGTPLNATHAQDCLNRAVAGLESLIEEAMKVIRNAARHDRPEDMAEILNTATLALRNATLVKGKMYQQTSTACLDPLEPSTLYSEIMVNPAKDFYRTGTDSEGPLPTAIKRSTNSRRPTVIVGGMGGPESYARSQEAVIEDTQDEARASSEYDSVSPTPPRMYQLPAIHSAARNFASSEEAKHKATSRYLPGDGSDDGVVVNDFASHGLPANSTHGLPQNTIGQGARKAAMRRPTSNTTGRPDTLPPRQTEMGGPPQRILRPKTMHFVDPIPIESTEDISQPRSRRISRVSPRMTNLPIDVEDLTQGSDSDHSPALTPCEPSDNRMDARREPRTGIAATDRYDDALQPSSIEHEISKAQRLTATITCLNTIFIGLIAGVYAGEVPRIQYQIADQDHLVLYGNVLLFACLGLTTLVFWPLPLLHGRKPYVLLAFALLLPLQFPQALAISSYRNPRNQIYRVGLLLPRALAGLALGFANINFLPTLFDLYGASLMAKRPHQEVVIYDDVRRQGGGMGLWLGIWTFCFSSALSIGFCIGACIIAKLDPSWGFYIVVLLLAFFLLINVVAPETRRAPYRRSIAHFFDKDDPETLKRRVARGEIKLHISNDGPEWWFQEVWAGILLTTRMILQPGLFVLICYMAWIKAQLTLVILLLGALLSRDYRWKSQYVGLAALAVPIGAVLALPLTKASWFSRSRMTPPRTDSMTFQPRVTWTSHLLRRVLFSFMLPFAALAYCLTASGPPVDWTAPVIFSALIGFLTDMGLAECVGLIMETFDTCDLQPGVNTRHRLQSMPSDAQRRRTNYSAFPRVCAAFFAADAGGFLLSAVATAVAGVTTRAYGAQTAIAIVAAVLLAVTILLLAVLWRWKEVQVVPNYTASATFHGTAMWTGPNVSDPAWRPVIVGNPSGKMRRMNLLELGSWSRWTEIRKLNGLIRS